MPIVTTRVAVISGLLLLGLLAVAVWLLASASPASAQTDDTNAAPQSASTDPAATQQPGSPTSGGSVAPSSGEVQLGVPDVSSLPADVSALTSSLPSVADVVPPALQPAVNDVSGLLPAPVRAPVAPLLSHAAPPPPRVVSGAGVESGASPPSGSSAGASTTAGAAPHGWPVVHGHTASELRASGSSSHQGGTRAPSGVPSPVAAVGSVVSSSAGRGLGQGLLLFGVVAAGVMFVLGGGRRLWREATGWLPASWCLLIERPG